MTDIAISCRINTSLKSYLECAPRMRKSVHTHTHTHTHTQGRETGWGREGKEREKAEKM